MSLKQFITTKLPFVKIIYRTIFKPKPFFSSKYWIKEYLKNDAYSIVQIGANDGVSGDPIYNLVKQNTLWNVLFVEPVKTIYNQLKANYGNDSRFKFENAAINTNGKPQRFYIVNDKAFNDIANLSEDFKQIGSFNKAHITDLSEGLLDEYIEEIEVTCLTLDQLFLKHHITKIDLLIIDAEGYDWNILSQLDLDKFKPQIISFEYFDLPEAEKQQAISFLKNDYYIFSFRIDFCCIKKELISQKHLNLLQSKCLNL